MSESLKTKIIQGAQATDTLWVEELGLEVTVRALTDGEASEARAAALAGQVYRGGPPRKGDTPTDADVEVDVAASSAGQAQARRIKVAYGLSTNGESWKPAEVAKYLPPAAVSKIAAKVDELGGGDELAEQARQFRDDTGWSSDRDSASDGDAAGDDTG